MTREELQAEYSNKLKALLERGNATEEERQELISYFDKAEELGMNYFDIPKELKDKELEECYG